MQDIMPFFRQDLSDIEWADEAEMKMMIENRYNVVSRMTPEYLKLAATAVFMQADSEMAGAYGYWGLVPIIQYYSFDELGVVSETAQEEFGHALRCYRILKDLGFDTDEWVRRHPYARRLAEHDLLYDVKLLLNGERPSQDGRVDIFYYPLTIVESPLRTAIRFAVFQFFQDRGAGVQLRDALCSSFEPWARENREIMLEEADHLYHGEEKLAELNSEYPEIVQSEIMLWLPRVIATFGKPQSSFDDQLRKYLITSRTHEEKLRDFLDGNEGIHTANERSNMGLDLPTTDKVITMWQEGDYLKTI